MPAQFPPAGACDCHVHVIGPKSVYSLGPSPSYTPMDAPVGMLAEMLDGLGIERVVIVQPSIFGSDNSCLVHALNELGSRARGVAVLERQQTGTELDRLHKAGIRGLRLNLISAGRGGLAEIRRNLSIAIAMCERNNWHVQLFATPDIIAALLPDLSDSPVRSVIDHFGMVSPQEPDGWTAMRRLLDEGKVSVKLSAPYRIASNMQVHAVAKLARTLAANAEAVLWGSDWPHTPAHNSAPVGSSDEVPYRDIDTKALLDLVGNWFPDADMQRRILVDNPARVYGWE